MRRHLRAFSLGSAALCLSACLLGGEGEESTISPVRDGFYRLVYPPDTGAGGLECELILGPDGSYRQLYISEDVRMNAPFYSFKGDWRGNPSTLAFVNRSWSQSFPGFLDGSPAGVFYQYEEIPSDSGPLRQASSTSFQRYEIDLSTGWNSWLVYQRMDPFPSLAGKYVFRDTIQVSDSESTALRVEYELIQHGGFLFRTFLDDRPDVEIKSSAWTQAGTFLVALLPERRYYDGSEWMPPDSAGEWMQRLRSVNASGFEIWDPDFEDWFPYLKEP